MFVQDGVTSQKMFKFLNPSNFKCQHYHSLHGKEQPAKRKTSCNSGIDLFYCVVIVP